MSKLREREMPLISQDAAREIRQDLLRDLNALAPGGVVKRLDEHRELWALLTTDAPEFLTTHWWVAGWFDDTDAFLSRLVADRDLGQSSGTALRPRPEYVAV